LTSKKTISWHDKKKLYHQEKKGAVNEIAINELLTGKSTAKSLFFDEPGCCIDPSLPIRNNLIQSLKEIPGETEFCFPGY
jgi:hypothetical protein